MSLSPGNTELSSVAALNLIYEAGLDHEQRPILVLPACRLPNPNTVDYDIVFEYLTSALDHHVEGNYVLVFFAAPAPHRPSWIWMLEAYRLLDRKYKKNLKALYVVHLTGAYRFIFALANRMVSPKFAHKFHTLSSLQELGQRVRLDQLMIPSMVIEHELKLLQEQKLSTSIPPLVPLVFGRPLEDLARHEGKVADDTYVPASVRTLTEHLRLYGMNYVGLFRESPSQTELQVAKYRLNIGEKLDLSKYDIKVAAGLLKALLNDLPEALIPAELTAEMGDLSGTTYPSALVQCIREKIENHSRGHPCHLGTLRYLFSFLANVARSSDTNRMSAHNLAIVFGPNLIRSNDVGVSPPATTDALMNVKRLAEQAKRDNAIVEMLILKHKEVFGVGQQGGDDENTPS